MDLTLPPAFVPAVRALSAEALCRRCDPADLPFETTETLEDLPDLLGQARAAEAIEFGIGIRSEGYNLFAMGPEGLGRRTAVRRYLERLAPAQAVPPDWCYVFNFQTPHKPRALRLPPSGGARLKREMEHLVEEFRVSIPAAFDTDEYRRRRQEIEAEVTDRQDDAIGDIGQRAHGQGIALLRTPAGFGFAPVQGEEVMEPEAFRKLPAEEQRRIESGIDALQEELRTLLQAVPGWRREAQKKLRELNREVARAAVDSAINDLRVAYRSQPEVDQYLGEVQEDVLERTEFFLQKESEQAAAAFAPPQGGGDFEDSPLRRYQVNVVMEHAEEAGAPIIYEDNPTHGNLIGRIEHMSFMGTLVTDFTLIKAGALHRANGGYLILDAWKMLTEPYAWEALKRALRSREIRIESLGQSLSLVSTVSLEPEPIPLDLKIVLIGPRMVYYLLHAYDPEFSELFKVAVDFEEEMDRSPESDLLFARLVATLARREKLAPFDRGAVMRVIEHWSRNAGDADKLSIQMRGLLDLLREADFCARRTARAGSHDAPKRIGPDDVQAAIDAAERRASRVREKLQEEVERGRLLLDTSGERVGQVNGLSVMQLAGYSFGHPTRITARVRFGGGHLIDIEREVALGGPIHSKGVLILSGYLSGRYAPNRPFPLSASLVFEQSYGGVEGDSASSAELYALLSAIGQVPLKQSLAVTGSVNQHGDVQAIGGVNEKIEGFFALCKARGLTGQQGVLIPASNVGNLMLKREVIEAVSQGLFHIYPVATVDEGMEILTGLPAGQRNAAGHFPPETINARVEQRLVDYAERSIALTAGKVLKRRAPGGPAITP